MNINRKVSGRELRRQLAAQGNVATVANANERITRQRVDGCERAIAALSEVLARGFWGRVTWLVRGR